MQLNTSILDKMGWVPYSRIRGIGLNDFKSQPFSDDPLVRYFIHIKYRPGTCYILKELSEQEKQNSNNKYKFIEFDYRNLDDFKFKVFNISTNQELFGLIAEYSSTNSDYYKRHFTLNKIIR